MKNERSTAVSVFEFQNYRSFMVAHFEATKARVPGWSYEAWARKLGLKNNTSLIKVVKGQREAGPKILHRLEDYFRLSGRELDYFRALVFLSKSAKNPEARSTWMTRLMQLHPLRRYQHVDEATFSLLSKWYGFAIRQMTYLKNFDSDPQSIAKRLAFKVTAREIAEMIDNLLKLKLLTRDANSGRLHASTTSLNTSDDVASESLKRYHEGALENARLALRSIPPRERQISGLTLAVRRDQLDDAKKFIREFEDQFIARFACNADAETVYQMETAFFPLVKNGAAKTAGGADSQMSEIKHEVV